jgi:hypothetical protein
LPNPPVIRQGQPTRVRSTHRQLRSTVVTLDLPTLSKAPDQRREPMSINSDELPFSGHDNHSLAVK